MLEIRCCEMPREQYYLHFFFLQSVGGIKSLSKDLKFEQCSVLCLGSARGSQWEKLFSTKLKMER